MTVDIKLAKALAKQALMILSNELVMPALVHRDFENDIGKQGKTIEIIKPPLFVANDFDPAVGITVQDPDEDSIEATLDRWKEVSFQLPDLERSVSERNLLTEFLRPAMIPLAEAIEQENVQARWNGVLLLVPVGEYYSVKGEIKNVITAVAKTIHYWQEHLPQEVKSSLALQERIEWLKTHIKGWLYANKR